MSDVRSTLDNEFPPPEFPVTFVDGVTSLINSATIVKMYLARIDPRFDSAATRFTPTLQVVIPMLGFVNMVAFFDMRLRRMIDDGQVTEAELAAARAAVEPKPQT